MSNKLMLLKITVDPQSQGMDIVLFICKLGSLVQNYSTHTKVLYKFKVTGEPQILAIIQVEDVVGLERTIAGLYRLGNVSVSCSPLYTYETFASSILHVDKDIAMETSTTLPNNDLYWLEFQVDYHGKSLDQFLDIWRNEAMQVLKSKAEGLPIVLFKVVMERKVHCFISMSDISKLDELSFRLPLMSANGENVQITCKAIQNLEDFKLRVC